MGREDDELYSGYDEDANPLAGSRGSAFLPVEQGGVPGTAMAMAPGTAMKPGTAQRMGTAQRLGTAAGGGGDNGRPMTSNRGAGFSSVPNKKFDPLNQSRGGGGGAMLQKKTDASEEEQTKDMEKKVHLLLEESSAAAVKGDANTALEKAMEARKRERALCKFRESHGLGESINFDLTYAVDFNLAHMYHQNKNYQEALDHFTAIVKNKQFPNAGRLRVNMGNIYFEQKKYTTAIKMYRMALDQIPGTAKEVRFKLMRNIGLAFVRMGQYQDALSSFSTVMENVPDHQTGFNLCVSNYAMGDREGMRESFIALISVDQPEDEDADDDLGEEDDMNAVVQDDGLKDEIRRRQNYITRCIVSSAQLISEKIDRNGFDVGYDWCISQLRERSYIKLANEVELAKASKFLANKEFEAAVGVFKDFEKKEPRVKARAATNLAYLYFLENQLDNAEKYSDLALKGDRYNARAFVNKGNVLLERGDLDSARSLYNEAAGIDPYCVEAIFNLGLTNQRLEDFPYALAAFKKLHAMLPDNVEVIYQIGNCYDIMGDFRNAVKWFEMLSSLVPNDPGVLCRLGAIHARFDDEIKALHYYQESHRVFPVNMDVISWLGAYHVKNEVYEKAMPYFDLASKVQPSEVKWALMVASCFRRIGAFPQALAKYKEIHASHPDNVECLRYLVHLCTELGRRDDTQEYMNALRKAEKQQQAEATAMATAMQNQQQQQEMGGGNGYAMEVDSMSGLSNVPVHRGKKVIAKEGGDDDWGNEQLGDDLLPM